MSVWVRIFLRALGDTPKVEPVRECAEAPVGLGEKVSDKENSGLPPGTFGC